MLETYIYGTVAQIALCAHINEQVEKRLEHLTQGALFALLLFTTAIFMACTQTIRNAEYFIHILIYMVDDANIRTKIVF